MKDISPAPAPPPAFQPAAEGPPDPRRTTRHFFRILLIGLAVFGFGPAFTYGWLSWLLNEEQWRWTYLMYVTEVPLVGGLCVLLLPWRWYRPINALLHAQARGAPVDPHQCALVYVQALRLPGRIALGALAAALVGYVVGTSVVHWKTHQPLSEVLKTLPAIPLVAGMMGAFCYFGTRRVLHPVVAWCSRQLADPPKVAYVPMATKFMVTTCVLAIAVLCFFFPAAYTLGQVILERNLQQRALEHLERGAVAAAQVTAQTDDPAALDTVLSTVAMAPRGYAFIIDADGAILTRHPRGFTHLQAERLFRPQTRITGETGAWVDRVGDHRVVSFRRLERSPWTIVSIARTSDFGAPLQHFMLLSWVVIFEVLLVVIIFGRYYTRGITTPLAELTIAADRIARHGDLAQRVPITTNDELSELGRSFNRMVEQLQDSKGDLEQYTKQLERSTQELSALNQEMEDLLRVVSHDLRAPLINIQGFSRRLEPLMRETLKGLEELAARAEENGLRERAATLKSDLERRFTESMGFISKGVEKMDALLASLLAVSRVGRKADPVLPNNLNQILEDVLATFDHQLNERAIHVIRHPLPTPVPCRRNEINQVLSNLLSNAINYMGATGDRFIEIGGTETAGGVECYVRDTGVGIDAEDHERVFHMFTRLGAVEAPGEGIGLSYARKILRGHGGTLSVASRRGQGSVFTFTLPRTPVAALQFGPPATTIPARGVPSEAPSNRGTARG